MIMGSESSFRGIRPAQETKWVNPERQTPTRRNQWAKLIQKDGRFKKQNISQDKYSFFKNWTYFPWKPRCHDQEHINNHQLIQERNFRTNSQDNCQQKRTKSHWKNEKPTIKKSRVYSYTWSLSNLSSLSLSWKSYETRNESILVSK